MKQKVEVEIAIMKSDIKNIETKLDEHILSGKEDSNENKIQQDKILCKLDDHITFINKSLTAKADKSSVESLWKKMDKVNLKLAGYTGAITLIVFALTVLWK